MTEPEDFMKTTRRQFIKTSSSAMLAAAGLGAIDPRIAMAQQEAAASNATLVIVYLRGGADPLNTIVPFGDPQYYKIRPTIAIPARSSDGRAGVIPVSRYFGLHPAMKELGELYQQGIMAPILCTGSTHPTRSHFDAQDFMERAAPGIKTISEGWLNRYLYDTRSNDDSDLRGLAVQPTLPRSLRGQYPVLAVPDSGAGFAMSRFSGIYSCDDSKQTDQAKSPAPGKVRDSSPPMQQKLIAAGAAGIEKLNHLNALVGQHIEGEGIYPEHYLAHKLQQVARVIKSNVGLEIAAIDYRGWDHHAYQGDTEGVFADMLSAVSQSIRAFVDDLGPQRMQRVMLLTMSEFGRTVRENGTNGSDHGHGSYMMAIGGPVNGGKIYGKWTGLNRNKLYHGRDVPVHTDFRDIFAETLLALFGFHTDTHDFFPEYEANARSLGLLKSVV